MELASEQGGSQSTGTAFAASHRVRHLLAISRAHFVERGFDAVSIDSIARAGGVSKETIYRHFADKEALFRAALEIAGEEFTARMLAVHDQAPTVVSELAGLARAILDAAIDQGLFSALWVAVSVSNRMPDLAAQLHGAQWQRLEPVRDALEHYARERGVNRPVGLELALDFGSLAVEGPAVLMGFSHPDTATRDEVASRVAVLFAHGVAERLKGPAAPLDAPPQPSGEAGAAGALADLAPHIRTLLSVAASHFIAHGYEGANLDEIGTEARVGRGTLYRHAGSKAGLFASAMRMMARQCAADARYRSLTRGVLDRQELVAFLDDALESLGSETSIQVHRTVISQSRRDPALARDIFTIYRAPWSDELACWLASMGLCEDPRWHARQLLALVLQGNRLLASGCPPTPEERQSYARRAATIFLDGFVSAL